MKIFVTGGTGFVGRYFIQHAIDSGHSVIASYRGSLPDLISSQLIWVKIDLDKISDANLVDCDGLVHFAAVGVSPKEASLPDLIYWNVSVTASLIEAAAKANIRRIVIAGSFSEYGRSAQLYDRIPPNAPLLPTNSYAASKAACFMVSYATAIQSNIELCYLRIFSAFGIGQSDGNFWPSLRKAALSGEDFYMTGGEQIRDFIPVEVVALEFLNALICKDESTEYPLVSNVGSGRPVMMRDFAKYWWDYFKASGSLHIGVLPYRPNEVMRFVPLITKNSIVPL